MSLENKIVNIFIANHLPQFKKWLQDRSLEYQYTESFHVSNAFDMSFYLGVNPNQIIDLDKVSEFYDAAAVIVKSDDDNDLDQAISKCDPIIIKAISKTTMRNSDKEALIIKASDRHDPGFIELLVSLIEALGDRDHAYYHLNMLLYKYGSHWHEGIESHSDYLLANFILEKETLMKQWLDELNAINPDEKWDIVLRWCDKRIDEKRVLNELFYGQCDKPKEISKVA